MIGGHICSSGRCQTMVSHHAGDGAHWKEKPEHTDAGGEVGREL